MNIALTILAICLFGLISLFIQPEGAGAILLCLVLALVAGLFISKSRIDKGFLLRLFAGALLVRVFVGALIFYFELQGFFGEDASIYDHLGYAQLKAWHGQHYYDTVLSRFVDRGFGAGSWGMLYMVAAIYEVLGRNTLAVQFANAVMGAASAPLIYLCAREIFDNVRVSRFSGLLVAFYPSLVLWSSQGLKDGPTIFLLILVIYAALKLRGAFSLKYLSLLLVGLVGVLSMRFYIFYMVAVAITGGFIIGRGSTSAKSFARQFALLILIGIALTQFGILRYAEGHYERYGSLQAVQLSRADAATSAKSGFATQLDVSTPEGAITTIPTGLLYLMFAPFPWQLTSFRQAITMPEMVIWWASMPLLILGAWFTLRYRLRQIFPIFVFTTMLTLAYSIFQGNIGNAYRQRSQVLVFYFIFVAVGLVLLLEWAEEQRQQLAKAKAPRDFDWEAVLYQVADDFKAVESAWAMSKVRPDSSLLKTDPSRARSPGKGRDWEEILEQVKTDFEDDGFKLKANSAAG